jgi:Family of unknown function (DUF6186)
MTRLLTVLAFTAIGLAAAGIGRWPGSRVPTLGELATLAMRHRTGRVIIMACWIWVGWHFFGR